jgi:hypothetical protein
VGGVVLGVCVGLLILRLVLNKKKEFKQLGKTAALSPLQSAMISPLSISSVGAIHVQSTTQACSAPAKATACATSPAARTTEEVAV